MSRIAYVNGRYVPQSAASVNVEDRGYQFADGVYEVLYLAGGRFLDEELHMKRLERSLGEIGIKPPMGRAWRCCHVIREVVRAQSHPGRPGLHAGDARGGPARPRVPHETDLAGHGGHLPPHRALSKVSVGRNGPARPSATPDLRWERCDIKSTGLLAERAWRSRSRPDGRRLRGDPDRLATAW